MIWWILKMAGRVVFMGLTLVITLAIGLTFEPQALKDIFSESSSNLLGDVMTKGVWRTVCLR